MFDCGELFLYRIGAFRFPFISLTFDVIAPTFSYAFALVCFCFTSDFSIYLISVESLSMILPIFQTTA